MTLNCRWDCKKKKIKWYRILLINELHCLRALDYS
uniref:Uncharacterized protein n=1 Tax=Rhizophora mucronata TaxID=61149 RepID=A0A2P2M895_RHIMU